MDGIAQFNVDLFSVIRTKKYVNAGIIFQMKLVTYYRCSDVDNDDSFIET